MWRGSAKATVWTLIASFGLFCGLTPHVAAQIASTEPSPTPETTTHLSSLTSTNDSTHHPTSLSPTSLDPYRSLEKHVQRVQRVPFRLPSSSRPTPTEFDVRLSRGQKVLLGTLGLIVHGLCHKRTDGAFRRVGEPIGTDRYCRHCERVGDRAASAIVEGLFSPDP